MPEYVINHGIVNITTLINLLESSKVSANEEIDNDQLMRSTLSQTELMTDLGFFVIVSME